MPFSAKHHFTSPKGDDPDTTLVNPSNWNAEHDLNMDTNAILGRYSAGAGPVQELSLGAGFHVDGSGVITAGFDSGTAMVFYASAAPTGWWQENIHDYALRVVNTNGGPGHGEVGLSQWQAQAIGAHALTVNEMPSHTHTGRDTGHSHNMGGSRLDVAGNNGIAFGNGWQMGNKLTDGAAANIQIDAAGASWGHVHPLMQFAYVDVIICRKY
jgi:hypothetical protein